MLALLLNFVTQVATVRYLAKADFGALSWALSVVAIGTSVNLLGLSKGVSRLVPMHEERGDHGTAVGTILVALLGIIGLGVALVVMVFGIRLATGHGPVADPLSAELLLLLVALSPLGALDHLLQNVSAVFLGARGIFFRRHVLGPLLRLVAIGLVIGVDGSVQMLAAAHLVIGVIGVLVYVTMLWSHVRASGLWTRARASGLRWPGKELFSFSVPLLSADLVGVLQSSIAVLVLERYHGSSSVAGLRAVAPVAALCLTALESFKFLYVPATSRHFAKGDHAAIGLVYWSTALWVSVFSFPVFAVSCFLAEPVTQLLFGERYATSGTLLLVLAVGNYFNACTGLNAYTLQVYGRVRLILLCNILAAGLNAMFCVMLIPRYGALGASIATTAAVVSLNIVCQFALVLTTKVGPAPRTIRIAYARIVAASLAVGSIALVPGAGVSAITLAIVAATVMLVVTNRAALDVGSTFPELAKFSPRKRDRRMERRP